MELAQRVADQAEMVCGRFEFIAITSRQCRPGFSGCGNTLARLRQHSGIKTAKTPRFIVDRHKAIQRKRLVHRIQCGRLARQCNAGLRAKEKQVLDQSVCNAAVPFGKGGVLHQDA